MPELHPAQTRIVRKLFEGERLQRATGLLQRLPQLPYLQPENLEMWLGSKNHADDEPWLDLLMMSGLTPSKCWAYVGPAIGAYMPPYLDEPEVADRSRFMFYEPEALDEKRLCQMKLGNLLEDAILALDAPWPGDPALRDAIRKTKPPWPMRGAPDWVAPSDAEGAPWLIIDAKCSPVRRPPVKAEPGYAAQLHCYRLLLLQHLGHNPALNPDAEPFEIELALCRRGRKNKGRNPGKTVEQREAGLAAALTFEGQKTIRAMTLEQQKQWLETHCDPMPAKVEHNPELSAEIIRQSQQLNERLASGITIDGMRLPTVSDHYADDGSPRRRQANPPESQDILRLPGDGSQAPTPGDEAFFSM